MNARMKQLLSISWPRGMQSEKNWYTACSTIRSDDILVSSNVGFGPCMILHADDGDDNDDNDGDSFCHRYMQAMSHGYACKCLLVSSLALIRHTNCVLPQEPLALSAQKKAIPKTPVLSLPSKSAENLQGWRSHMHVMLAMLVGKQAVHNSCMNKQGGHAWRHL